MFEPMVAANLPTAPQAAVAAIEAFFAECRERLFREAVAPSKQNEGRVPDNPFGEADAAGQRPLLATPGLLRATQPLGPRFTLVIKHNAAFTAVLPQLVASLPVLAVVRNPLAVLASWHSVPLPVREGRVPAGERLDPELARVLVSEPDRMRRQLHVLEWFFARFAMELDRAQVLRYEDIVAGQGAPLFAAAGLQPVGPVEALTIRNSRLRAPLPVLSAFAEALLAGQGSWRRWYDESELVRLLEHARAHAGSI
ncbi:MAG TPA: hypothetical protein VFY12_11210 [Arenimonas sp.]|nr:hypothetical protein [Arenimonas sp.]